MSTPFESGRPSADPRIPAAPVPAPAKSYAFDAHEAALHQADLEIADFDDFSSVLEH